MCFWVPFHLSIVYAACQDFHLVSSSLFQIQLYVQATKLNKKIANTFPFPLRRYVAPKVI